MDHFFNVEIARQFDTDTAIFIQHIKFWTFNNLAKNNHIYDGLCWSYETLESLTIIFPYWSKRQMERVINNCVKNGLIMKGNYNATAYDRTCWYALTPVVYGFYPELLKDTFLKLLHSSISPNGEIDFAKWRNGFPQTVTPIPDIYPDNNTNTNNDLIKPKSQKGKSVNKPVHDIDYLDKTSPFPQNKETAITTVIEEVVSVYHEELPECPKIKKIGTKSSELYRLLVKMMKNWPEYSESKSKFTLDSFRNYLRYIKQTNPGFLQPYTTKEGNVRCNNLKTLIREDNILKFINGEFNFK